LTVLLAATYLMIFFPVATHGHITSSKQKEAAGERLTHGGTTVYRRIVHDSEHILIS
jgi:hypothetical protein